jgi:hypothetical protein
VIVYLWDAPGPKCSVRGVTDNRSRAVKAAEECVLSGRADSARIEEARPMLGYTEMTSGYHRLGRGWMGSLRDGGIAWEPFAVLAAS